MATDDTVKHKNITLCVTSACGHNLSVESQSTANDFSLAVKFNFFFKLTISIVLLIQKLFNYY